MSSPKLYIFTKGMNALEHTAGVGNMAAKDVVLVSDGKYGPTTNAPQC